MAEEAADGYPRDLLLRFGGSACADEQPPPPALPGGGVSAEKMELSLGLSLGSCFGAEPEAKETLVRSSLFASFSPLPRDGADPSAPPAAAMAAAAPLTRTSSLPEKTEEVRRKRKEMQSLKRMVAKRKRLERRNSINPIEPGAGAAAAAAMAKEQPEEDVDSKVLGFIRCTRLPDGSSQFRGKANGAAPSGLQGWAAGLVRGASLPVDGFPHVSSVSLASQGSCSSGILEFESQPGQAAAVSGIGSGAKAKSPSTGQATAISPNSADRPSVNCTRVERNPWRKTAGRAHSMGEVERDVMEEMPCVSTTGDGPDGRRVEGFLYKYRKVEEVRIVCVCHGRFLTPAEFVRHAGGGDVANPLQHIVVSPSTPACP